MKIIGVTGGISSGKSTVTRLIKEQGDDVEILDADKFGHEAYKKDSDCWRRLIDHFGSRIRGDDGEINRRELGSIVFADKSKMEELEAIVWPEIRRLLENKITELRAESRCKVAVIEAAIMIEAGWQDMVDTLWVVVVDRNIAIDRLMKRNNISKEDAERRVNSQITNEERIGYANRVITNDGDEEVLKNQVALALRAELEGV